MFNIDGLYFQSGGCKILSKREKKQGFNVKLSAVHHLPLYDLSKSHLYLVNCDMFTGLDFDLRT